MNKKTEKEILIKEINRILKESEDVEFIDFIYMILLKADKKA